MKRKALLLWLAVAFQVGVVASMALSREWILATGTPHIFQTAPIDPRDIFRGDYVRLDYLFSSLPVQQLDEAILERGLAKGQKAYLSLSRDSNGVSHGTRLYASPPQGQAYIAGRSLNHWPYGRQYRDRARPGRKEEELWPASVKYGIEQYYVQQGTGRAMESLRGGRNEYQVPLLIHARVSASGEAVIRSYEWANVAMKTEIARSPQRDAPEGQASAVIRFTLMNRSQQPLTLPLETGNCSFTLIPAQQAPAEAADFAAERSDCLGAAAQAISLAPGETHSVSFDLNQPHWQVNYQDKPTPPGKLPWRYRYRIRYQGEAIPGIKAELISRSFHGSGNID
jgi:uncharacterized membrane-anchored protein